jgi:cell division protein ZipA
MTTLRVLLLLVGAAFIVGVWWWSRREQRVRGAIPSRRVERLPPQPTAAGEYNYDQNDEDLDIAGTLADLSGLMREGRQDRENRALHAPDDANPAHRKRAPRSGSPQQLDIGFSEDSTAPETAAMPLAERVIALYVRAVGRDFDGPTIVAAFAAVNMRFGEMAIFHHYGVGNMHTSAPIFSAANMFEPGSFDLSSLNRFTTRGIAFFMRLPGPKEPSLAFELMLNTAQRMARELHGEVLDDTRAMLGSHSIEQLRALVKQYDRA